MRSLKPTSASTTLALLALATVASSSEPTQDSGWYIGANAGQTRANIDDRRIAGNLMASGLSTTMLTDYDRHFGLELFGGYQVNRYFALEGGYYDLGRFGYRADTNPAGNLNGQIKLKGANLDAVGILPFTEKLAAFGRIGVTFVDARDSFSGTGAVIVLDPRHNKGEANYKFGGGLRYNFTAAFELRAEAERYRVDDAVGNKGDIDMISLGMVYHFRETPSPPVAQMIAEPVAKPAAEPFPVPEVVPVVVPVAPQLQEYCSILDFQFEVNQSDIQRQEKEKLRVIGTFLRKYPATSAQIEGYSDNVGKLDANLRLSQRRADAVVRYLVDTFHIAPARLSAVGYGESHPVGDNETEEGKRMNRRIAAVVECTTDIQGLTVRPARVTMSLQVEFDRNEAAVRPEYHDEIGRLADFLTAHPSVTATVEGHTANLQATPALALSISQLRAQNVVNYLADSFGIARSRLSAEGFGDTRRIAYNTSPQGQQENRRVDVIINYPK